MILTSHQTEYRENLLRVSFWQFGCKVLDTAECLVAMDRPGKNELGELPDLA